jgi:hypothetical protein
LAQSKQSYRDACKHSNYGVKQWPMHPVSMYSKEALSSVLEADSLIVALLWQQESKRLQEIHTRKAARHERYLRNETKDGKAAKKRPEPVVEEFEMEEALA